MGAKDSRSTGGGGGSSLGAVQQGEKPYVSFAPTKLHPEGEAVIVETPDGKYRFTGQAPQWTQMRIDRSSNEYKQAIREYNIKATRNADGSITAHKGGLYPREKKYKSMKDFKRDAEKRMESRGRYDDISFNSRVHGNVTQIEAENFKTIVRRNTKSDAIKKIKASMSDSMRSVYTRYTALQDAKERLRNL